MSRHDWDPNKAATNLRKHGVSFEDARGALDSPLAHWFADPTYNGHEERYWVFGYSDQGRLLLVVTSEGGGEPRIISAWRATKRERREYERRR